MKHRILFLLVGFGLMASASAQSSFERFTYSAGGGFGIGRGDVGSFVGNSFQGTVGGGLNISRLFAVDAEYMYYDLNFRSNVKQEQALSKQSGRMQSVSLDGIVNVPRHIGKLGAYGIFGVGFYVRSVSVPRQFLGPGTVNEPAYRWFDLQYDIFGRLLPQYIGPNTKDAGGFNYGGGLTYRLNHLHNAKLYAEYRYHRAYHSDEQTIVWPITIGLRW